MALVDLMPRSVRRSAFVNGFSDPILYESVTDFNESMLLWAKWAGEGIVVAEFQNRIIFANPFVPIITQYSLSELGSLGLDQMLKVHYKSWLNPKENYNSAQATCQYRWFKVQIIHKEGKTIAVKGTTSKTKWFSQPAIFIILKAKKKTYQKEKALKHGLKKMRNLFRRKSKELAQVNQQLQQLQLALDAKEHEVNHLKNELLDTNNALSTLARHLGNEKKAFESEVSRLVITNILPILKTLQQDKKLSPYTLELNLLESYIESLSPNGLKNQSMFSCLSKTEGHIASLIKKGMTSKKIASLLCISGETVRTHRKNIRRKLKIQNTDVNLQSYLSHNPTTGIKGSRKKKFTILNV